MILQYLNCSIRDKMFFIIIKCIKFIFLNTFIIYFFYDRKNETVKSKNNYSLNNDNLFLFNNDNKTIYNFNYLKEMVNTTYYFKVEDIRYYFSFKRKMVKLEYDISFYDEKQNLIVPSDIALYYNISLLCNIEIIYNNNISIDSMAGIKKNKYFNCIEFFNLNESIKVGIKIYNILENITYDYTLLFTDNIFKYKIIKLNNDKIFDSIIINYEYNSLMKNINNNKKLNDNFKLKKSYLQYPLHPLKRKYNIKDNFWKFENILGNYFCFGQGQVYLNLNIPQYCKYNFYINIIDNSRDLYLKTDYLFVDFIFSELSSDDVYPIFEEMKKRNYPVHYITEKLDIYKKFCYNNSKCLTIIPITKRNYYNYGDFIQKYLTLLLKLKAFISGKASCYRNISILFYNIEYITYIAIGHGVCYFKDYLYQENRLYGNQRNDKILIPPSKQVIYFAKKYGWKDGNIIKLNLPRWDKYNKEILSNDNIKKNVTNQSILIMFTWRSLKKNQEISHFYIKNSILLLNDPKLKKAMNQYNITLYFAFHRFIINKYKSQYNPIFSQNKYINYIEQNEISDCLSKTSLVVSDFSSIIFDFIYRRKPFIIYIPDANDSNIKDIYKQDYYQLIESLKNGNFSFENKFFDIKSTVEKIIYYFKNNFNIEKSLTKFYDNFELKLGPNINNFIKYLDNLI